MDAEGETWTRTWAYEVDIGFRPRRPNLPFPAWSGIPPRGRTTVRAVTWRQRRTGTTRPTVAYTYAWGQVEDTTTPAPCDPPRERSIPTERWRRTRGPIARRHSSHDALSRLHVTYSCFAWRHDADRRGPRPRRSVGMRTTRGYSLRRQLRSTAFGRGRSTRSTASACAGAPRMTRRGSRDGTRAIPFTGSADRSAIQH